MFLGRCLIDVLGPMGSCFVGIHLAAAVVANATISRNPCMAFFSETKQQHG